MSSSLYSRAANRQAPVPVAVYGGESLADLRKYFGADARLEIPEGRTVRVWNRTKTLVQIFVTTVVKNTKVASKIVRIEPDETELIGVCENEHLALFMTQPMLVPGGGLSSVRLVSTEAALGLKILD